MSIHKFSSPLLALALGLGTAVIGGCVGGEGSGDASCAGDCQSTPPAPPISANSIVDCWVLPAGSAGTHSRRDVLECRYQPPENYPVRLAGARVFGRTANGTDFSRDLGKAQIGEVVRIATIADSAYPLELAMDIRFDPKDRTIVALQGLEQVRSRVTVKSSDQLAKEQPAKAYIPFDLWEINLLGRDPTFSGLSFNYSLDAGAGYSFDVDYKSAPLLFGRSEHFYLPVDTGTFSVDANLVFAGGGGGSTVQVTGSGDYAVRDGSMHRAESSDLPVQGERGSVLAACWFATNSAGYEELHCQGNANHGLAIGGAVVSIETAAGKTEHFRLGQGETLVAAVSVSAFPLRITLDGQVQSGIVGLESLVGSSMQVSATVESASNLPRAANRQKFKAPFEVWQATIQNRSERFEGRLDDYVLELGKTLGERFASRVETATLPSLGESSSRDVLVATTPGQYEMSATGTVFIGGEPQSIDFVLHPGTNVVGP